MVDQKTSLDIVFSNIDKTSKERKLFLFMGDLKIDLLNFENWKITREFISTVVSYDFLPHRHSLTYKNY